MSEQEVYVIPEQVHADLAVMGQEAQRRVKFHVMTAQQASEWYWDQVKSVLRGIQKTADNDRRIAVQCTGCYNIEHLPGSVLRWYCKCAPHEVRWTFKDRIQLHF